MKQGTPLLPFISLLFLLGVLTQAAPVLPAEDPLNGPWDRFQPRTIAQKEQAVQKATSPRGGFFPALLTFFQKTISRVDGDRCPSFPTCAAYSKQAYHKHGALLGTLMTVDRLIHETSEERFSPTIEVYGVQRIYDPVAANEFWKRDRTPDSVPN